jgi:hypothetical protein
VTYLDWVSTEIGHWIVVKDGDTRVSRIYQRHYSCYQYADNRRSWPGYRNRNLVMGPGEKMVLLSADGRAIFGWRKFIDRSGQEGVNCAFFRNEGAFDGRVRSSELIRSAELLAWSRWPGERLYTYVDPGAIKSTNPGYVFKVAGWKQCALTQGGLIVLKKYPKGECD